MILIIDNYDSFVYNLKDYVESLGYNALVERNDEITVNDVKKLQPTHIIISPGPCTPKETGNCKTIIKTYAGKIPILGICLGHQTIAEVFGSKIIKAKQPMHGKVSAITLKDNKLFEGIKKQIQATRYHSLVVENIPKGFEEIAYTYDTINGKKIKVNMGIANDQLKVYGLQFHPESIMTKEGKKILGNFLKMK